MAIKISGDTVIYDDKVFRVGSGTSSERPASPALGMIWYNTEIGTFEGYNGTIWGSIGGAGADGGFANSVYLSIQKIDGGDANG